MTEEKPTRRSMLEWAIHGMGALFAAVLGVPAFLYLIDPRNREAPPSDFRDVDDIDLSQLQTNVPQQGVIRNMRVDAWTLHPNDVVGRVWVVKHGEGTDDNGRPHLHVFTTICPHLGCSVNVNNDGSGFQCPCHGATFQLNGDKQTEGGVAPRGMDTLAWQVHPTDPNTLQVRYQNFRQMVQEKTVET